MLSTLPSPPSISSDTLGAELTFPDSLGGGGGRGVEEEAEEEPQPFLYARQTAGGGGFSDVGGRYEIYADRFAYRPSTAGSSTGASPGSPTSDLPSDGSNSTEGPSTPLQDSNTRLSAGQMYLDPEDVKKRSGDSVLFKKEGLQEVLQGPVSSAEPHISTFVVFMPDSSFINNDPTAVRLEDVKFLEKYVTNGGHTHSIHRAEDAENWVEMNYDSTLLKSLRSVGLGGPLATMLSTDMPALAIFGSIVDNRILELAQRLSDASTLPVMVQPVADDPVTIFSQSSSFNAHSAGDAMDDGSESDNPSSELDASDDDSGSDLPTDKVFRLRGGATGQDKTQPDDASDYLGPNGIERPDVGLHRTNIDLHLNIDENCVYDVEISSETMFKFQTDKAETADPLTESLARSQVLSCVDLKVEMRPSEVCVDRSYSNIGFLVHQSKYIAGREYLARGFERPTAKATHGTQTSTQTTQSLAVGLADMKPTLTGTASRGRATGKTVQFADEKAAPPCEVKGQVGKKWDSDGKCYSSYDVAWYPANDPNGIPHPVDFRFGMGIKFYGRPERYISKLPRISHILRNQIIMWIYDPSLKAKVRGIVVLTTTYIPDITVSEPLSILEDQDVNLERSHVPPPADATSLGQAAANSVAIGLFEEPKEDAKTGMRKFIQKFAPKSSRQKPRKTDLIDLPLHEYVARGWDQTNQMWRNTVWPTLDEGFRDAPRSSAAWNMSLISGTPEDDARAVVEATESARLAGERGDDKPTRRTNHVVAENSDAETGSSEGSNVKGVHVILPDLGHSTVGMAGSSIDSGSDDAQVKKPLSLRGMTA
ncbi:WD-REPEATS-REGION domain-containing protein [Mycena sanguinolenta]|uniref:WD-REPEATS-REGION domain-containing protein n=1 Tax=Mycena sanguinolenta TaxID=230812 RepID=A0A8H6XWX4_9AGAR|nr:WD-REPEATS-REGION domain-containing protein [Mycena sanguinolenta]